MEATQTIFIGKCVIKLSTSEIRSTISQGKETTPKVIRYFEAAWQVLYLFNAFFALSYNQLSV